MNLSEIRHKLSRQIIIYSFLLILFVIIVFIARGFDAEQFTTLIGILGPITAVYMGALFKYLGKIIPKNTEEKKTINLEAIPFGKYITWIVPSHFIVIFVLISVRGLFNFLSFNEMILILTFIETTFGAYMGYLMSGLFESKND